MSFLSTVYEGERYPVPDRLVAVELISIVNVSFPFSFSFFMKFFTYASISSSSSPPSPPPEAPSAMQSDT
jgi:hypothetical protein